MATWPTTLCPLAGTYQEAPPNNTIRTSMDRGPDKVRRRTTANIRPISFKLLLSAANVEVLDDFFVNDTFSGADQFDFIQPRTGAGVQARFIQAPTYSPKSNKNGWWDVSVQLEILP